MQPDSVTVKEGDVFNVTVVIENLAPNDGMVGYELYLTWNNSILNALSINEVLFHEITSQSEWDNIWQIRLTFNNTKGEAEDSCTWMDGHRAVDGGYCPVNGISGNHTLAVLTMEAVGGGSTSLHLPYVVVGDMSANPLVDVENGHTFEVPRIDPSENVSFPEPTPTLPLENLTDLLGNLTGYLPITVYPGIVTMPAQTAPSQQNATQEQDAPEVAEMPLVMLAMPAAISIAFIALPARWRRVHRTH